MDGEVVILDEVRHILWSDVVGASVWTLIEQPVCLGAIREAIMSEYDVDAETCDRDILAFLDKMQAVGLVEVSNGAIV
jgi:hypothetical protein